MPWIVLGAFVLIVVGALAFWLIRRRRRRHRLISFVALLREPVTFDPAVLARVAGKAWKADLGDGENEGADGFVACTDIVSTIVHDGRMFLINSFARPYVDDPEKVAESIGDLRVRALFAEHLAWFSCDALGVDHSTPEAEVRDWYRRLARLFVELLDESCLAIYLPDVDQVLPINEDTEMALRSKDPIQALEETLSLPIVEVSGDDPLMVKAVEKARETWPKFVAAYEADAGENFSIKAPVTHGENTEFIWISVTAIEGDNVYGELANDPGDLGPLKLGSKVVVPVSDLNDWCYIDGDRNLKGGYTIEAVQKAAKRARKQKPEE